MNKLLTILCVLLLAGCAKVYITKTAEGYYEPTDANHIEILKTAPKTNFVELGTLTITGFNPSQEAKMHNGIRQKASALGATSVIITDQGMDGGALWASGVAIYEGGKAKIKK
jgi:hypothetical protein